MLKNDALDLIKKMNSMKTTKSTKVVEEKKSNLSLTTAEKIGKLLARQIVVDEKYLIVCDTKEICKNLNKIKIGISHETVYFFVSGDDDCVELVFCIIKYLDRIYCLYTDFMNTKIPEHLAKELKTFDDSIDIRVYHRKLMKDEIVEFLLLQVLEQLLINTKPNLKDDFIENFAHPKNTRLKYLSEKFSSLKARFNSYMACDYENTFSIDLDKLANEKQFLNELRDLIQKMPLAENAHYNELSAELVAKEESGVAENELKNLREELAKAKDDFFKCIEKLKCSQDEKKTIDKIKLSEKYPNQMEMLNNVFEQLRSYEKRFDIDEKLAEISAKLNFDLETLKKFYKTRTINPLGDKNNMKAKIAIRSVNEIMSSLPILSKSSDISQDRSFDQLMLEIENVLKEEKMIKSEVIEYLRENHAIFIKYRKIWSERKIEDIRSWANSVAKTLSFSAFCVSEILAIMDRLNFITTAGHKLRDTQVISILSFLYEKDKSLLAQVQTGEGKTTIVAIIAAIKALQGRKVDVITSNEILASNGVETKKIFYEILNLTVDTNNLDVNYREGERKCYNADVVYGTIGNFQFDFLKDSFLGLSTRAGRKFDLIILDEVDSMIIDNASHIAKLSSPFPGMESLKYIYINIWMKLQTAIDEIMKSFEEKDNLMREEFKDKQLSLEEAQEAQEKYNEFVTEITDSSFDQIIDLIKASNPCDVHFIPSHIRSYANKSLDKWINSALDAKYNYKHNVQYIISQQGVIQPVDYSNTGVTMKNTIWQHGLHQFLQLKHGLRLTAESLTSCFISNLSFIRKYESSIYGLTGTLGSDAEKHFIASIYDVEFIRIPTYRRKRFVEYTGEIVDDENFALTIAQDAITIVEEKRACLVICETIRDAKMIENEIKNFKSSRKLDVNIKIYLLEENSNVTTEEVEPGTIIIATNIAGRGTDLITTDELDKNGGLHVCVAFLPCNKRVEDQAFGRTARQGRKGTAQILMKQSIADSLNMGSERIEFVKLKRDWCENARIHNLSEKKVKELQFQDKLFELFSDLYTKTANEDKFKENVGLLYAMKDLKEFWAFWLTEHDFTDPKILESDPNVLFNKFREKVQDNLDGKVIFNPYYCIHYAEALIMEKKYDEAERVLQSAISMCANPEILYGAYMKLFEISVRNSNILMNKFKHILMEYLSISTIGVSYEHMFGSVHIDGEYKEKAMKYLALAKTSIENEMKYVDKVKSSKEFNMMVAYAENNDDDLEDSNPKNEYKIKDVQLQANSESVLRMRTLNLAPKSTDHEIVLDTAINAIENNENSEETTEEFSNVFLKHFESHEHTLMLNMQHSEELAKELNNQNADFVMHARMPHYITDFEPSTDAEKKTKEALLNEESVELSVLGFNTAYGLRKLGKPAKQKIRSAIYMIEIGFACCDLPFSFPIGTTLISEGISDIVMELIFGSAEEFTWKSYLTGKLQSFAISFLTWGIAKLMKCRQIFEKAEAVLTSCAKWLRSVQGPLSGVCKFMANQIDKLAFLCRLRIAKLLEIEEALAMNLQNLKIQNADNLAKLNRLIALHVKHLPSMATTAGLSFTQIFVMSAKSAAIGCTKQIVADIVIKKIVAPSVRFVMSSFMSKIIEKVKQRVRKHIDKENLKYNDIKDIEVALKKIKESSVYYEILVFAANVGMELSKQCSNWMVQLTASLIDQGFKWKSIYDYAEKTCEMLNEKLDIKDKVKCNEKDIDENIEIIGQAISDELTQSIENTMIDACKDAYSIVKTVATKAYQTYTDKRIVEAIYRERIQQIIQNGPVGVEEMGAACDVLGISIEIVNEQGEEQCSSRKGRYQGDPVKLVFYPPTDEHPNGHYVIYGDDPTSTMNSGENNCAFEALGKKLGVDPNALRRATANKISENPSKYIASNIYRYKLEHILMEGGCPHVGKYDKYQVKNIIARDKADKTGHPDAHTESELALYKTDPNWAQQFNQKREHTTFVSDSSHFDGELQATYISEITQDRDLQTFIDDHTFNLKVKKAEVFSPMSQFSNGLQNKKCKVYEYGNLKGLHDIKSITTVFENRRSGQHQSYHQYRNSDAVIKTNFPSSNPLQRIGNVGKIVFTHDPTSGTLPRPTTVKSSNGTMYNVEYKN